MGIKASKRLDIKDQAKQTLLNLRNSLNETVFLSIWGGNGAPYPIDILESNRSINIGIKVGHPTSIILTTSGRLFAAFLPDGETDPYIQKEFIKYQKDPVIFKDEISKVRLSGYSVTSESLVPGIVAVGCPIFDRNNSIIATISIVGISGVLDLSSNSQAIAFLSKECLQLSHSLGYTPNSLVMV
jgi:DNA-binding IclR family transcriptional regulator